MVVFKQNVDVSASTWIGRYAQPLAAPLASLGYDLADLDLWLDVGKVGNVGHQLFTVCCEGFLEVFDRIEHQMARGYIERWCVWGRTREPLLYLKSSQPKRLEPFANQVGVLLGVVHVVKLGPWPIGVEN